MAFHFIYITAASADQARSIGRALVEERLAACVNILENMRSFFWWEGKIDQAEEAVLIAKTRDDLIPELIERVKALHSYTMPCVVALRVTAGNPEFLEFLASETKAKRRHAGLSRRRKRKIRRTPRKRARRHGKSKSKS